MMLRKRPYASHCVLRTGQAVSRTVFHACLARSRVSRPQRRVLEPVQIIQSSASYTTLAPRKLRWRPQGDSNPCYRRERAVS
jgi:hypothetical protein